MRLTIPALENLSSVSLDINQIEFTVLGIVMIVVGNIMPKLRMNSIIGLRTTWSLKNETTWKKSQHFGGISFIIAGVTIICICFFTNGWKCFALCISIMLIIIVIDIIYTYKIAKKY